jgi:NSS family neurotransmitter:Na+ symporter
MAESASTTDQRNSLHGNWSSRLAFILAVTGSAVGLGNIWRFPYTAGENGGGAFVLIYLASVVLIGLPIMMAEIMLGRRGRRNPVTTMQILGQEEAGQRYWGLVGLGGIVAGFLILSYYSVIAGWTLAYVFKAMGGAFANANAATVSEDFGAFISNPAVTGFWHTVFILITVIVVSLGVQRGIENAVRVLVPGLVIALLVLLGFAITSGDFATGAAFLFTPDFSKVTGQTVLEAMGQAFFSLSIGMGAVMAYGAYLPQDASIPGTAVAVVSADTAVALLSGLVIFPIVFANGLDPAEGPGLVFQTLPIAFGQMPGGAFVGFVFFVLLAFAALTSSISLMEPAVAWIVERFDVSRKAAAVRVGLVVWLLGFGTVASFSYLSDFKFLAGTILDNLEYLANNIMLPVGGLCMAVFAGWFMCANSSADELDPGAGAGYRAWRFLARYIAPTAVLLVLLNAIGVFR